MRASPRLVTVDSEYLHPGVAACYLRVQGDEAAFVETNTALSVPRLLAALQAEGLDPSQVRWIVVTHVHLDHAGGASALLAACPNATVLAHPRAARHLIDPSRLVASAAAVYGAARFASLYGTIAPCPADRVRALDDGEQVELGGAPLRALHTRGHANHHFVVHDPVRDTVFTGDTFGLVYPRLQRAGLFAFPSTSPTDFDAAEARASIDRVLALGTSTVCPTHFGEVAEPPAIAAQLRRWIDRSEALVEEAVRLEPTAAEPFLQAALEAEMERAAAATGLALDPDDRALLALDLQLNAQGLAFVAAKRRGS